MSRFYQPLPFSTAYDFVAAKPVTLNGAVLNPGDPVDKEGLNPRRLRQLYEARIITPVAPEQLTASQTGLVNTAPQEPQEPAQEPSEPEGEETPAETPEAPQEPATAAPDGKRIEHRGFGRYFVLDADGNEIAGPLSKADAQAQLEA